MLGIGVALILYTAYPYTPLNYTTFIGYTVIVVKELVVGLTLGFTANMVLTIINAAGQFIDRELGFSMVSNFDQTFNTETTISAQFYSMLVMILMLVLNLHYYILSALSDSFTLIPLGNVTIDTGELYDTMIEYITQYFIIALRISLPVLIAIMLLNVVLGVLAKTAPQMNMFVVGIQLKIFVGFGVIAVTLPFLSTITGYLYEQMQKVVMDVLQVFY